jgi:hypothetical protein
MQCMRMLASIDAAWYATDYTIYIDSQSVGELLFDIHSKAIISLGSVVSKPLIIKRQDSPKV